MKSSEEVLALINHVRHKKVDGSLYVMSERMAWAVEKTQTFSVTYNYSDIRTQKISPDGKVKIQLQIVLHTGETANFHFNSPEGQEKQLNDRKKVKELLQQLLPRFRKQLDAELEEKNILLQQNPQLFTLYKELVVTQIINPEEFWDNYASKYKGKVRDEMIPNSIENYSNEKSSALGDLEQQSVGVSASFLSDLIPESDGANGIKYNLTTDIIDSIFRTYPSVRKKYGEFVPYRISEMEFWTKFFQSHYFYRDRNLSKATQSKDYFFAECAKLDEKAVQSEVEKGVQNNPLLNLDEFEDETPYSEPIFDLYSDIGNQNLSLIQRFNQHSILLSQATFPKNKSSQSSRILERNGQQITETSSTDQNFEIPDKKVILQDRLHNEYMDLEGPATVSTSHTLQNDSADGSANTFKLNKPSNFFQGPSNLEFQVDLHHHDTMSSHHGHQDVTYEEVLQCHEITKKLINDISKDTSSLDSLVQRAAPQILSDLSPGGRLMDKSIPALNINALIPGPIVTDLKNAHVALNELLRHFYACFPVTNPHLDRKLDRMKECLANFHSLRVTAIEDKIRNSPHPDLKVTQHIIIMLEAAFDKYARWVKGKNTRNLLQNSY